MVGPLLHRFRNHISEFWPLEKGSLRKHDLLKSRAYSGIHHYDVGQNGNRTRVHLRFSSDLSAVMFVDVSEVIHLNQSAAEITWLALEKVPIDVTRNQLAKKIRSADRSQLSTDINRLYEMVNAIGSQDGFCPGCSIGGVEQTPLFSLTPEAPYKVDLALTYGCNNHCTHCYNEPQRFPMPSMTRPRWKDVIDKLHEIGVPHLIFTGGEATLHPDLSELINYADSKGMITGLNTNGRRLSYLPFTEQLVYSGLNHVQVTLASHQAELHDEIMGAKAFKQTIQGIRNAQESGLHVITNTTITRRNCHQVILLIDFLHELGIRTFAMNGMIQSGGGQSNPDAIPVELLKPVLTRVRDESRERHMRFLWYTPTDYCTLSPVELDLGAKRCNAGEYSLCIEPDGSVLPCQSFYVAAGNILRDPWETIWQSDLLTSFRQRETQPAAAGLPHKCWSCPEISLCGGGCRIEHMANGTEKLFESSSSKIALESVGGPEPGDPLSSAGFVPPVYRVRSRSRGSGL